MSNPTTDPRNICCGPGELAHYPGCPVPPMIESLRARVAKLDAQLSAVLAEAHLNGTYTPTCAKAEAVLTETVERPGPSVSTMQENDAPVSNEHTADTGPSAAAVVGVAGGSPSASPPLAEASRRASVPRPQGACTCERYTGFPTGEVHVATAGCVVHDPALNDPRPSEADGSLDEDATRAAVEAGCDVLLFKTDARTNDALPSPYETPDAMAAFAPRVTGTRDEWVKAAQREQVERINAQAEVNRLRNVIRTGGAMYRAERAVLGIPGGHDADVDNVHGIPATLADALVKWRDRLKQAPHDLDWREVDAVVDELSGAIETHARRSDYPKATAKSGERNGNR